MATIRYATIAALAVALLSILLEVHLWRSWWDYGGAALVAAGALTGIWSLLFTRRRGPVEMLVGTGVLQTMLMIDGFRAGAAAYGVAMQAIFLAAGVAVLVLGAAINGARTSAAEESASTD